MMLNEPINTPFYDPLFELTGVTRVHGGRTVLDIPELSIEKGLIYALLGPNGAGKTTLLNILGFLDSPTEGTLRFAREKVRFSESTLRKLRGRVVMLDQHPILFTGTVFQNVEFGLKIRKIPGKKRVKIVSEVLDLVGMGAFSQADAAGLSGGETQRVALARVLAVNPSVLLCDEPTASVDLENQAAIVGILRRINREFGITIIFTNHDRLQAASLAHRTLLLDHGRLVSTALDNIFSGEVMAGGNGFSPCDIGGGVRLSVPSTGRIGKVRLLINPEKIRPEKIGSGAAETDECNGKNGFSGTVVRMAKEGEKVRIDMEAGVLITALLSSRLYEQGSLRIGDAVNLTIEADAVRIL